MIDLDIELPDVIASFIPQDLIPANISLMKKGVYGSVSAIQPVFMGGQIINGNKLAKVGVEASELQLEASEDQVELTTEQYYWQMVSLKEKQQTLKAVLDMLETLEKDVTNMVRVGAVNRNDLLQVQLRKGEVETAQLELENGLATVSQLLAQHIGKTGETIDVVSSAAEDVPELPFALRQDHQTALATTPQYRLLEKNVESHRLQHKMKVGQNLPNVGVGASYSYNDFFEKSSSAMVFAAVQVPISGWWGGSHAKGSVGRNPSFQLAAAHRLALRVMEGVYAFTSGPVYETPAEIRAYDHMGADIVGMSTVPEAVFAKACGMKVAGLSLVSNYAAGIASRPLTHDEVMATSAAAKPVMAALLDEFVRSM